jgi:hypothetical protein
MGVNLRGYLDVRPVHVIPVNDMREHDEQPGCWCEPRVEAEGEGVVIIHNSMDGRELIERHGLQ